MVKKVNYGRDRFVTLYCFHNEALQRRIEALPEDFKNWSYDQHLNNHQYNSCSSTLSSNGTGPCHESMRQDTTPTTNTATGEGFLTSLPCFIRELLLINDKNSCSNNTSEISMRETLYNDLLLKIAQNEDADHIRPVQFVHEWGSVSY